MIHDSNLTRYSSIHYFKGSKPPEDISPELIGDLTAHYVEAPESSITS